MLQNRKKLIRRILSWAGLVFFCMAAAAIYSQLSRYSAEEIKSALFSIPARSLAYSLAACVFGYFVLALYDRLAIRYVGKTLAMRKWLLAGFLGFAISNNAGTAVVSGAAIRYRLYTGWKFRMHEIFSMIIFSGVTYFVGCVFIVVVGYFFLPPDIEGAAIVHIAFWPCLAALVLYFSLAAFYKKSIEIGGYSLRVPSLGTAAMQAMLGMSESLVSSVILYLLLSPLVDIPFSIYVGVFVVSHALGMLTPVPGALGVFEGLFMLLLPIPKGYEPAVFGALIARRVVYFLIPLIIAGLIMLVMYAMPYIKNIKKHPRCKELSRE